MSGDRYNEAEPHLRRALAIRQKTVGKQDPTLASDFKRLANLYTAQHKYPEAEMLFENAVSMAPARSRRPPP
jgi:tetratricopeptide (TPR) repeat protein